jgi:hypothetical protein
MVYSIKHIALTGSSNKIYCFLINSLSLHHKLVVLCVIFHFTLVLYFTLVLSKVFDYNLVFELCHISFYSRPIESFR